uniref:hypothetical protein n=1 Tax=Cyanothece sp. BG0011 TaxID=2082950 RepID=UPI000D1F7A9B
GKENNPRGKGDYDKTATLLELIEKGLNPDSKESDSQVSGDEKKQLRDELLSDLKQFLSYRLKAFKSEMLDSVKQDVEQVRLAIIQEKESIEQVIEDDGTIRRINLEIADIYLQLKDLKEAVSSSSNSVEQTVKQVDRSESPILKQIENEILYGFDSLPLQEKRKKINILSRKFPAIKDRIKEVLSERKNKPTRLNYSALNSKECIIIYKQFTGENYANGSK